MTTDKQGGADWEIGEAARKLSIVLGVEGEQAEALRLALSDHAAAVGSKSTQMIAALFGPLMSGLQGARADLAELSRQQTIADARLIQSDRAIQDWRVEVRSEINRRFDAFGDEFDLFQREARETWERLGGLTGKVEDHEVRIVALEVHGAPAKAVDEIHLLTKRIGRVEFLVLCLVVAVAANALIFILAILIGGGR